MAITPRTAERLGLAVGSVVTGVVGTADDAGSDGYAPENVVTAVGGVDEVNRIDLRVAPGESAATVRQRVAAALPAGMPVSTGTEVRQREADAAADQVGALFALVGMFVAIAVVAAALVVTSTFRIVFAQRMRQLALLRAVGANRGALVRALTAEGALTGSIAGVVGVAAALCAGHAVPSIMRAAGLAISSPWVARPGGGRGRPRRRPAHRARGAGAGVLRRRGRPARGAAGGEHDRRAARHRGGAAGVGLLLAAGAVLAGAVAASRLPAPDQEQENYSPRRVLLLLVMSGAVAFFALVALGPADLRRCGRLVTRLLLLRERKCPVQAGDMCP